MLRGDKAISKNSEWNEVVQIVESRTTRTFYRFPQLKRPILTQVIHCLKHPSTNFQQLSCYPRVKVLLRIWHTFSKGMTNSLSSFLGSVAVELLAKQRARNEAVSAFTDGVLCSSAVTHDSLIASRVVCETHKALVKTPLKSFLCPRHNPWHSTVLVSHSGLVKGGLNSEMAGLMKQICYISLLWK